MAILFQRGGAPLADKNIERLFVRRILERWQLQMAREAPFQFPSFERAHAWRLVFAARHMRIAESIGVDVSAERK
jgi:hypothetical protein